MQKIYLYAGRGKKLHQTNEFVMVDDEYFEYLNQWKWFLMKIYHTENKIYYARRYENICGDNRKVIAVLMHRVILDLKSKDEKADHKDGNGLNNQRDNLRKSTHSQNMSNRKQRDSVSSIYFGVYKNKRDNNYAFSVKHNGISTTKSGFVSEDVAAFERNKLALSLKGEFARLNIIRWY